MRLWVVFHRPLLFAFQYISNSCCCSFCWENNTFLCNLDLLRLFVHHWDLWRLWVQSKSTDNVLLEILRKVTFLTRTNCSKRRPKNRPCNNLTFHLPVSSLEYHSAIGFFFFSLLNLYSLYLIRYQALLLIFPGCFSYSWKKCLSSYEVISIRLQEPSLLSMILS